MNVTFDIPRASKSALEEIKTELRDKGFKAFERSIIQFLIESADRKALEAHFKSASKRRKRARKPISTKSDMSRHGASKR